MKNRLKGHWDAECSLPVQVVEGVRILHPRLHPEFLRHLNDGGVPLLSIRLGVILKG